MLQLPLEHTECLRSCLLMMQEAGEHGPAFLCLDKIPTCCGPVPIIDSDCAAWTQERIHIFRNGTAHCEGSFLVLDGPKLLLSSPFWHFALLALFGLKVSTSVSCLHAAF